MTSAFAVAYLIARRNIVNVFRIPGNIVTVVGLPVLVLITFSGTFSRLTGLPGFPTRDSLSWVTPYAIVMGAAFAGLGSGYDVARDVAAGFMDRLLVSPTARTALVLGEVIGSVGRAWMQLVAVLVIAIPAGADVHGGAVGLLILVLASAGVATWSGLWALAVMYRLPAAQSLGLVTVGIFAVSMLTTGQVPLRYQAAWLGAVARVNPMTPVLAMSRQGFIRSITWTGTWPGLLAMFITAAVLASLVGASLRRLAR